MSQTERGLRIAIAGATSLSGKQLIEAVGNSNLAAAELRLLDEEFAAGTLTEAGGEPALVKTVDEESFSGARFVFFTGSAAFATRHAEEALAAGSTVIDLSGGLAARPNARFWIPSLDTVLAPPFRANGAAQAGGVYVSPSAPAQTAISLAAALRGLDGRLGSIVFLQPVSELGSAGIEELESQTVKLLSFQPIGREVFDAQVAFNLMDRYGPQSKERLSAARERLARDVARYLTGRVPVPGVTLVQAPVFYSHTFMAYAELDSADSFVERMEVAGLNVVGEGESSPTNVSVAGESRPVLGRPDRDLNAERGWWIWGAADNLSVAASNAIAIAENVLGS
jgi:aspartate-semialdehyde dehydrogenase